MPPPAPASPVMRRKWRQRICVKILFHGAAQIGEPVEDVTLAAPGVVRGKKGEITFADLAHAAEGGTGFGVLVANASYITPDFAFPYGANFAEVAVNTRTGEIRRINSTHCSTAVRR